MRTEASRKEKLRQNPFPASPEHLSLLPPPDLQCLTEPGQQLSGAKQRASMDGPLAGGLAAPDRPRGPERLPGPALREDIEGGAEVAEGEGCIFRSTHYLPVTKEGPQDILDGRGGISGKRVGPVALMGASSQFPKAQGGPSYPAHQGLSWDPESAWVQSLCLLLSCPFYSCENRGLGN